ncbi:TolB family protein [Methanoregula formicica]|uniref:Periplasmic component of the Tol biopolymer transport system n=1 Tax=Methanoregula formicica (strain DSM 22288 / NBRC 105244 / SMSP) TaxID=593750 RepID=L0HCS3_METFS|nr:hypothetical protein [Methanoregula formicica]AGB01103.1 hypothetical protein Metfor_0015 [Methanoregula formicica SMSP]
MAMKRGILVTGIVLLLLFGICPGSGADSPETSYLIAKSNAEKYNAIACDEGNVAWVEYGAGTDSGDYSRAIYRYNVSGGRKDLVIHDPSWKRELAISGNRYVWSDGRGIFLYDNAQGRLTFLVSPASQYSPCIDGSTVVWVEYNKQEYSLVMYDAVSGGHRTVVSSAGSLGDPAISGDRVVYRESGPGNDLMILLNLTTMEKTVLFDGPCSRAMSAIDGDHVVWADGRNGPYQVFLYDLKSGISGPVSPSDSFQMYPDVSGDLIVWEDYRNSPTGSLNYRRGGGDIRLYDMASNMTKIVAEGQFSMEFPRISGEFIVWSGGRDDAHDVFLYHYPGNRTNNFSGKNEGTGYSATPTTFPTPGTNVRYYSTISKREIEWYSLESSLDRKKISFELRWNDPGASLSLTLVSPGGSTWHFTDADDSRQDRAVRMTISGISGGYLEPGKWTVAIAGDSVDGTVPYDLCWY